MPFKDNFTNLEQSRWLKEFFEKYPRLKPEMYYAWVKFLKDEYEFAKHLGDLEFMLEGENLCEYSGDFYPAYLLSQLEGILPVYVSNPENSYFYHLVPRIWQSERTNEKTRMKTWNYEYEMGNLGILSFWVVPRNITKDPFQNLIELLKLLDEKGCFGKGEM